MNYEHATPELFAALSKAQGEIENATKNAQNPHFRSSYANLAEILNTIRPPFAANGLSLSQWPSFDGSLCHVETVIGHASGGWISGRASCVPAKSDAQGIGAATTYLRRYGSAAAGGISQEDDDGNAAAHNAKPEAISDEAKAKAADFAAAIRDCTNLSQLADVAKSLGGANLPGSLLVTLREQFKAHKDALEVVP